MIVPSRDVKRSDLLQLPKTNTQQFESSTKPSFGFSMQVKKGLKTSVLKNNRGHANKSPASRVGTKITTFSRKKAKKDKAKLKRSKPIKVMRKRTDDGKLGGNESPHTSSSNTLESNFSAMGDLNPHMRRQMVESRSTTSTGSSTTKRIYSSDSNSRKWYKPFIKDDGKQRRNSHRNQERSLKLSSINVPISKGTLDSDDEESTASWEVVFTINSKGKNKRINLPTPITKLLGDMNDMQKKA